MKFSILTPLALASLSVAPAFAHDLSHYGKVSGADAKLTAAMDQLDEMVKLGMPLDASIKSLDEQIARMPELESMRARMSGYLADLADRAGRTYICQRDIAVFRGDFAGSRVEAFLGDLTRRAKGGQWTVEQTASVLEAWVARGRAFADAPDPAQYRARFRAAARQAIQDAGRVHSIAGSIREQLLESGLSDAAGVLRERKADGTASIADVARVRRLFLRRAQLRRDASIGG